MSLISRLGRSFREKPKSTNLNLPSLPVPREILEDIESCQNNDPIITLATVIQKKGRPNLLDSDFLEDPATIQQAPLAFLVPYQNDCSSEKMTEDVQVKASGKRKGSTAGQPNATGAYKANKKTDIDNIKNYNKLKQFLLLHEKSEELMESLEPHFKRIETTLKTYEDYPHSTKELAVEPDSDVCSSPLM